MINLFNINNHLINTIEYSNLLHDKVVIEFENRIAEYVGAKYACGVNSATSAIFLALLNKNTTITIPSMIPPVVVNAIATSGNDYLFKDDINWVGDSYILHEFENYKIIDSAQKIEKDQFKKEANDEDLMIFSFYPTKPIGSSDGGMVVSNDYEKIKWFKEATMNGMSYSHNNWERKIKFPGYKMYLNSIQATIAMKNMDVYDKKLEKLNEVRNTYNEHFKLNNTSDHLYRISIENRDDFIQYMRENEIICGIHYEALHLHDVYKTNDYCSKSEENALTTVSIPFHEELSSGQIRKIISTIEDFKTYKL